MTTRPPSARREKTRERLLDAAMVVFADHGVGGATQELLCAEAGLTRGAYHSNFASKDDLCVALLEHQATTYLDALHRSAESVPSRLGSTASVDHLIHGAIGLFLNSRVSDRVWLLSRIETRLYAVRHPGVREPLLALDREMSDRIGALMTATLRHVGRELTVGPLDAANLLYATYERASLEALMEGRAIGDAVTVTAMQRVLSGITRPVRPS